MSRTCRHIPESAQPKRPAHVVSVPQESAAPISG